jgi:hypothetical protein
MSEKGQRCEDIDLTTYLTIPAGPVPFVLDLHITHECLEVGLTLVLMDTYITRMTLPR